MKIRKVETDKKEYLPLLLLADEQEDMIDRYLERGDLYVLEDDGARAVCVVTDEGEGILEIKNLAVAIFLLSMHICHHNGGIFFRQPCGNRVSRRANDHI